MYRLSFSQMFASWNERRFDPQAGTTKNKTFAIVWFEFKKFCSNQTRNGMNARIVKYFISIV